ncbi:MAG: HpsJ family protein [Nostoc sp. DedVER02]|uniref:hormogonium polysaccharide biosynthesis protein HpsJ n=1 Tax=unclassified Nostoc TaxID=2593658 RepID=UPI002AD1D772|nr:MULTISPECIES: HpsJ family protein [unclassified Nostoc]MDZ7988400.1 HpsJ family protein [Nostoc sp. DedVER02]MDZ8112138.1 HpsJ family protein [Nostoc sp. DedVER01b]
MVNRFTSVSTALTVKVVGIICLLSFFVDFLILLLPFQPTDRVWQINLATALVDRGIVPLVGLGLLFAAYWIENADAGSDRPQGIDLRFPAVILSSLLGLMFLLIFPLHLNNVNQAKTQTLNRISQEADQAEAQLNNRFTQLQAQLNTDQGKAQLDQLRTQTKAQFSEILKDDQKYKQALESSQIPANIKELLKKAKTDPQALDKAIEQQTDIQTLRTQQLSQVRQRRDDAQQQAKDTAWKSGLRIGISSLLLSIGYIIIGWTGLKGMGAAQGGKPRATTR